MNGIHERVFLVHRRWTHHARHSGYDTLAKYIGSPLTANPIPDRLLPERLLQKMNRDMLGYDRTTAALELITLRHMATHKNCLYHLLYGESAYKYLGAVNRWRGHRLVATYHKPPRAFADMVRNVKPLKKLSAAIIVGRNQIPSFSGVLAPESVYFVPHPVDTEYFVPPEDFQDRCENLCLFVGAHLRDYETLRLVIEDAWILAPQVRFALVVHPLKLGEFEGVVGNYQIYSNIEEADLSCLYRQAALLVMPMLDTTANNTVLEGMACGLPLLVTNVGAIHDYVDDECARFVQPFDHNEMLQAILELLSAPTKRHQMGKAARNRSLKYDWRPIANQMQDVYTHILDCG